MRLGTRRPELATDAPETSIGIGPISYGIAIRIDYQVSSSRVRPPRIELGHLPWQDNVLP